MSLLRNLAKELNKKYWKNQLPINKLIFKWEKLKDGTWGMFHDLTKKEYFKEKSFQDKLGVILINEKLKSHPITTKKVLYHELCHFATQQGESDPLFKLALHQFESE